VIVNGDFISEDAYAMGSRGTRFDRWDFAGPQHPWLEFPGCCDDWRVGPLVGVRLDASYIFRTDAPVDFLTSDLGIVPPFIEHHVDQFDHSMGARAYVTSRYSYNFAMQFGYVGAAGWVASAENQFLDPLNSLNDETRTNTYESNLHAFELNIIPQSMNDSQLLLGMRCVKFDEDFTHFVDRVNFDINNNNLATGFNDDVTSIFVENHLIGGHVGMRYDSWSRCRRFSWEMLVNGGGYCNVINRQEVTQTFVTVNLPDIPATPIDESQNTEVRIGETIRDRDSAEIAFLGEAAFTGICRVNKCVALRLGYQAMWLYGAHLASDPFAETSSVFFHGVHFGLEYRR
jgi:hypothetical protein